MAPVRPLWLLLLASSLVLAGCSTPAADVEPGLEDLPDGGAGAPGGGDAAGDVADRWHGFAFDQRVTPRSGGAGFVQSYTARLSEEDGGKVTTFDLTVEVVGKKTMDIRMKRVSFSETYEYSEETVTTPVAGTEYKHTMTVVRDDTGEREVGSATVVYGFAPTEGADERTMLFGFARMAWSDESGESVLEYYLTPEQEASGETFLPYQEGEGDFAAHWGHTLFTMALSPFWLAAWADGDQTFEEGSWSFGGHSYETTRKVLSVGGYTFDGWRVEWSVADGDSTAVWMFEVAPALPVPFAYRFGGSGEGESSHWTYELRDLVLG